MTIARHVASLLALSVIVFLAWGSDDQAAVQESVASQPSVLTVSANQIHADYEANEIAADAKYKDKVITVTGTVDSIGKDVMDTMYVTLETSNMFNQVQCFFPDSNAGDLATIAKGNSMRIKGLCEGKFVNVLLKGCTIQ